MEIGSVVGKAVHSLPALLLLSLLIPLQSVDPAHGSYPSRSMVDTVEPGLEYAAIGPMDFRPVLEPLLEWKDRRGLSCGYFALDGPDGILNDTSLEGRDVPETIRNFLVKAHAGSSVGGSPTLRWVLLAGDAEIIPPRYVFVNHSAEYGKDDPLNYVPTDFYYAGLDGDWDQNGNGVFGEDRLYSGLEEQDLQAEVYVGRFPASDIDELRIMVNRQIGYETDPPPGNWSRSMLLAGSLMDVPNKADDPSTPFDEGYNEYKDNAYKLVKNVTTNLPEHVLPFSLIDYPQDPPGGYNRLFDTLNHSSFESHYEMGYSTVLLACHGDQNGNCTNYKGEGGGNLDYFADYESHFDYDMAATIDNGGRNPLVYISNCGSLNFTEDDDTNMERIMINENGGAIGIIGATTETFRGEIAPRQNYTGSYGNWWLAEEYFRLLYEETAHPAEALYRQKWNYENHVWKEMQPMTPEWFRIFRIDNLAYNLLGDPEGPIWTDVPDRMLVSGVDPHIVTGDTVEPTVVDAISGDPISGAVVHLEFANAKGKESVSRTNVLGRAYLQVDCEDLTGFTLTVTRPGYLPAIVPVRVVSLVNVGLGSLSTAPLVPVANQEVVFTMVLFNNGSIAVPGIRVSVSMTGETGTEEHAWTIGTLGVGERMNLSHGFTAHPGTNRFDSSIDFSSQRPIEITEEDNSLSLTFVANEPISILEELGEAVLKMKEDTPLSEWEGRRFPLWTYIIDPDDPISIDSISFGEIEGNVVPVIIGDPDGNPLLDIIPEPDWHGSGTIVVLATDGVTTAEGTIHFQVEPVHDRPSPTLYPEQVDAREDVVSNFTVVFDDTDGDPLNLSCPQDWVRIDRGLGAGAFNVTLIPKEENVGDSFITLIASDPTDLSFTLQVPVTVERVNDAPIVSLPGTVTIAIGEGELLELDIRDDSSGMLNITAEWKYQRIVTNLTTLRLMAPDYADRGAYVLMLNVTDSEGATTNMNITIVLEGKDSAIIPITIIAGVSVLLLSLLIGYGVFIRVQERRQTDYLSNVGGGRSLETHELSMEDFDTEKKEYLAMPPSDLEDEMDDVPFDEIEEDIPAETEDLDSDIDDVVLEFFRD